jgi:hypothetical protein
MRRMKDASPDISNRDECGFNIPFPENSNVWCKSFLKCAKLVVEERIVGYASRCVSIVWTTLGYKRVFLHPMAMG